MTKLFYLFSLIALIAFGCTPSENRLIITGTINNPVEDQIRFVTSDSTYQARVDSTGHFDLNILWNKPSYVTVMHGEESSRIYLMPDSKLTFELDPEQFDETIKLIGEKSAPSDYLLEKYLLDENFPNVWSRVQNDDAMIFVTYMDSITAIRNELLAGYQARLPEDFYQRESAVNTYLRTSFLTTYLLFNAYNDKPLPTEDEYYAYRSDLDFNKDELSDLAVYTNTLKNELQIDLIPELDWNDADSRQAFFENYVSNIEQNVTADKVKATLLVEHIESYKSDVNIDIISGTLSRYQSIIEPSQYAALTETITKIKALSPGSAIPNFAFVSPVGEQVQLSEFKGNLVYVDLWATWCGPCLREQPFMEKLIEEYDDAPVVFLAISIDNTQTPWKKMLEDRELGGTHVFAENNWSADIMKHFVVEGIPRYLLLDQEGKIIDANAPRPSGNIAEVLAEELAKIAL